MSEIKNLVKIKEEEVTTHVPIKESIDNSKEKKLMNIEPILEIESTKNSCCGGISKRQSDKKCLIV